MNTDINAWLWSEDSRTARSALGDVELFFHETHRRFTRFEPGSELSALNASAGQPFVASAQLFEVVDLALKFSATTDGLFNPTIIGALEAAGYDRTFEAINGTAAQRSPITTKVSAASAIVLDAARRIITLPIGVRIDLGGIAKGWAAQTAAQQLAHYGPCLIDAGGDIMTIGSVRDTEGWSIEIADPFDQEHAVITLHIHDQAVATSGADRRKWQQNGKPQHHLIDPRTGQPSSSDLLTVTVIAPTTVEAEIYAKTVFLLGSDVGLRFANIHPSMAAAVVTAKAEVLLSDSMQEYLDVNFSLSSTSIA
jgi:thiamine biosynthesis lipoprotein